MRDPVFDAKVDRKAEVEILIEQKKDAGGMPLEGEMDYR